MHERNKIRLPRFLTDMFPVNKKTSNADDLGNEKVPDLIHIKLS